MSFSDLFCRISTNIRCFLISWFLQLICNIWMPVITGVGMLKIIVFSTMLFSTWTAYALMPVTAANPQIRACNSVGGQFAVITSEYDQIGLCAIGSSIVGAIDILNKDAAIEIPLSLYNYRKGVLSCNRANLTLLTTMNGNQLYLCMYSDGSLIDIDIAKAGFAGL